MSSRYLLFRNRSWRNLFYWNLAALTALLTVTATLADDSQDNNGGNGNDNGGQSGGDGHRHDNGTIVSVSKTEATLTPPDGQSGSGHVEADYVETTTSTNQSFSVEVRGLAGNSTFLVNVTLTDGSTASAGSIATGPGGHGELQLSSSTDSQGGEGEDDASENEDNGGGDQPLPPALDPVTRITHVDILDANSNIVLSGDLTASGDLFHKVQSTTLISNGRAVGKTQIDIRHTNKLRQTITVSGSKLTKSTKVQVHVDGVVVGKAKTNAAGKLSFKSSVPGSIKAEHSQQIHVLDAKGNLLLTGQLPN